MDKNTHIIPWPEGLPLAYNGSSEPCDMLVGPCSCGAWHEYEINTEVDADTE